MKTIFNPIFYIFFISLATLNAQNIEFNDLNFKQALLDNALINTNGDDEIQISEAESYSGDLIVGGLGISDLTGLEHFKEITFLDCGGNMLTELDISKNVSLRKLFCFFNNLTSMELGNNEALEFVMCDGNDFEYLYLEHSYLDTFILRHNNFANPTIEIAEDNSITYFDLNDNLMSFFDPFNLSQIKTLRLYVNNFEYLDFAGNLELEVLDCSLNPLTTIKLSKNTKLRDLNIEATMLPEIDLSYNPLLEVINAAYTVFPTIDLSNNPLLKRVDFYYSKIESMNLNNGNNTAIEYFSSKLNQDLTCVQVDDSTYSANNWLEIEEPLVFRENCPEFTETSISSESISNVLVFPNPTSNQFQIAFSKNPVSLTVKIFDQLGRLVFENNFKNQQEIIINENLSPGIYFIEIETIEGMKFERLVVN